MREEKEPSKPEEPKLDFELIFDAPRDEDSDLSWDIGQAEGDRETVDADLYDYDIFGNGSDNIYDADILREGDASDSDSSSGADQ